MLPRIYIIGRDKLTVRYIGIVTNTAGFSQNILIEVNVYIDRIYLAYLNQTQSSSGNDTLDIIILYSLKEINIDFSTISNIPIFLD